MQTASRDPLPHLARTQAENHAAHLEKGNAVRDSGMSLQAYSLIKANGTIQIIRRDRDDGDAGFHQDPLHSGARFSMKAAIPSFASSANRFSTITLDV